MNANDLIIAAVALALAGIIAWSLAGEKHRVAFYVILFGCFVVFMIIGRVFFGPEMASMDSVIARAPNPLASEPMLPTVPRRAVPAVTAPLGPPGPPPRHFQRLFIAARALMPAQAVHAPDDAVLRCFRLQLKIAEDLLWKQPATLRQFLFDGGAQGRLLASYADPATLQAAQAAFADLVRQTVTHPQTAPVPAAAELVLDAVTRELEGKGGVDLGVLNLVEIPDEDSVKLCTTALMFYRKILDLPPVTASHVLRHLAAER